MATKNGVGQVQPTMSSAREVRVTMTSGPAFGNTDPHPVVALWRDVDRVLGSRAVPWSTRGRKQAAYTVRIHAADTIEYLESVAQLEDTLARGERDETWVDRQLAAGRHPMRSHITLHVGSAAASGDAPPQVVGGFLQQLFLAMNLACPGACNLALADLDGADDSDLLALDYSGPVFENAFLQARDAAWPLLAQLPFETAWDWLSEVGLEGVAVAKDPLHKALFTLLRIAEPREDASTTMLLVAQALEALLVDSRDNVGSILRQRIELIVGAPPNGRRWFSRFYELRSRAAHGSVPLLRPGRLYDIGEDQEVESHIDEFVRPADEAVAVFLAIVQDLARARARRYRFTQVVARE